MSRKESTFFNMIFSLSTICFVSAIVLAVTYSLASGKIEEGRLLHKVQALKVVLPAFDNNPVAEKVMIKSDMGELPVYPAKKNGQVVGVAVETLTEKGYSGIIDLMVGFKMDGSIYNIQVLQHKETPGLGSKIEPAQSSFLGQFKGKTPFTKNRANVDSTTAATPYQKKTWTPFTLKVKKDGGDVDAITAATISSRAVCDAVQRANDVFKAWQGKGS
jgi:electron transport complex protein RnfG